MKTLTLTLSDHDHAILIAAIARRQVFVGGIPDEVAGQRCLAGRLLTEIAAGWLEMVGCGIPSRPTDEDFSASD